MKILYDLVSIQQYISGGGEYVKRVLQELYLRGECDIIGVYDSQLSFIGNDFEVYCRICNKIVDIHTSSLKKIVEKESVDVFFIGIVQRFIKYNINNINCNIIAVIHDLGDVEIASNRLHFFYKRNIRNGVKMFFDYIFPNSRFSTKCRVLNRYNRNMQMLKSDKFHIVTVSEYTSWTIKYYFPELQHKDMKILYPPEKKIVKKDDVESRLLYRFFEEKRKYILMVSSSRSNKNADLLYKTFSSVLNIYPDIYTVFVGGGGYSGKNIVSFDTLSVNDLEALYSNAFVLIYPSLSEGFGYPPIEAMKYGIPVLSSNVCSMPEILLDSVVYFSPFYENDLYYKLIYILENREKYVSNSYLHASKVIQRQNDDLKKIVDFILKLGQRKTLLC